MKFEEEETARDAVTSQAAEKVESVFIRIPEAMEIMQCSRSTVQRCFAEINKKLRAKGCFVIAGRCNRREFYEAIGLER